MVVNESDATTLYSRYTFAPFAWVQPLLFDALPIRVRPFDLLMLAILIVASSKRRASQGRLAAPMRNALYLAMGTVVLWFVYGVATGGDARAASWQTYLMLSAVLTAFTVASTFHTAEHFATLAKAVVAAALYRAVMCWIFYFAYMPSIVPNLEYATAHDDSVVWVISILWVLVHALTRRSRGTTLVSGVIAIILLGAIQWNNRRLAWVGLVMALATAFFLLPHGPARRRVVRILWVTVPIVAIYAAVGWGRSERIFVPLRSIATVTTQEDSSTRARNVENLGLIATVRASNAIAGTGWGHGYIEVSSKYSIARFFELWPYIPHNSILGLLAYTGILGFSGYWLAFPTAIFLNSRVARLGSTQALRNAGLAGCVSMVVCANQMFGDMGVFSLRTMYLLAATYAVALRLPAVAGVWDAAKARSVHPEQSTAT
jgi:hypothetical protein